MDLPGAHVNTFDDICICQGRPATSFAVALFFEESLYACLKRHWFQWFPLVFGGLQCILHRFVGQCAADFLDPSPSDLFQLHLVGFPV
jgi:hypothetical protein